MSAAAVRITLNGEPREVEAGASVQDLLARLGLEGTRVAVERNGRLVPRREHAEVRLAEGDRLEVVTLVGGG